MTRTPPRSRQELAAELSQKLLQDLDAEKASTSSALMRLQRVAEMVGDEKVSKRAASELDGYQVYSASHADLLRQLKAAGIEDKKAKDTADDLWRDFPTYRRLSLKRESSAGFANVNLPEGIGKYEELLERIRKDSKTQYTLSSGGEKVIISAAEMNSLVTGVRRWVHREATSLHDRLEFGNVPTSILDRTIDVVDTQLLARMPATAQRLIGAYRNLAETNEENWVNVADTCRRVIKDFADVVFPAQAEPVDGLLVTDDKYLNRLRAFVRTSIPSKRQRDQLGAVLDVLAELLARTDNLASRTVHHGSASRYEAERILIYTYLVIGDLLVMSGEAQRPEAEETRLSLNQATREQLHEELRLTKAIADELIKSRKRRPFRTWEDVARVRGVGPRTLERLRVAASL